MASSGSGTNSFWSDERPLPVPDVALEVVRRQKLAHGLHDARPVHRVVVPAQDPAGYEVRERKRSALGRAARRPCAPAAPTSRRRAASAARNLRELDRRAALPAADLDRGARQLRRVHRSVHDRLQIVVVVPSRHAERALRDRPHWRTDLGTQRGVSLVPAPSRESKKRLNQEFLEESTSQVRPIRTRADRSAGQATRSSLPCKPSDTPARDYTATYARFCWSFSR
jgi:hypothetical protein